MRPPRELLRWFMAQLLEAAYPVLRGYYAARSRTSRLRSGRAVIVYQMGKVGSSTIRASLKALRPAMPVYKVHTLTKAGIAEIEAFYRSSGLPLLPKARHLLVSHFLRDQIDKGMTGGRWKVVTVVRDPIARNVSLLFQVGELLLPDFQKRCRNGTLDFVAVTDLFERRYPAQVDCFKWFDVELKPVFGVDVFLRPFPKAQGFDIYRGEEVDVLLLRLENIRECAPNAFREFLNCSRFTLINANVASQKKYSGAYARFLSTLTLPASYVDRIYASPQMKHFYSEDEIEAFRAKWLGTRPRAPR